ncbi:MAG: 1-(5-phosphoribosyl)-5-[(5-phosphoribosylamino)methylideneamino]imidazole-4-carboxamide isomerase [Anaerolineae bacterium]|nr:1-(5-phosphoribosyl)-5-[(5-phosphoribosylamino)methylideneamino]imidazole-4-carboxamide isomerase [Anaerolineae bacterium]
MSGFDVFPAIDLRQGRVVRLAQGDPGRETSYSDDPLLIAQRWEMAGASWVHVVNLDGAFGEAGRQNRQALARILEISLSVQFGGGIRDLASLSAALELGVARVVVGTAFVEDPAFVSAALTRFGPERVVVGIDARDGVAQIRGWQASTPVTAEDLARRWADMGGSWLVFTDISRDGMGSGVNVEATIALKDATGLNVIASGGVRTLADVERVHQAGLAGVIIGRALYEGHIQLPEALAVARA